MIIIVFMYADIYIAKREFMQLTKSHTLICIQIYSASGHTVSIVTNLAT